MKMIKTSIIAGIALFLTTGIVSAAELDDLDVTVRVVGSGDDVNEVEHELHLPDSASDSAREHAEESGHENETEHQANDDGREDHENIADDREDHEENKESHEDETEAPEAPEAPEVPAGT